MGVARAGPLAIAKGLPPRIRPAARAHDKEQADCEHPTPRALVAADGVRDAATDKREGDGRLGQARCAGASRPGTRGQERALDGAGRRLELQRPAAGHRPGGSLWIKRIERLTSALDAAAIWGTKPFQVTRDGLGAVQEGVARLPDRRVAGGLSLVAAVAAHLVAHEIEIDVEARVRLGEAEIEFDVGQRRAMEPARRAKRRKCPISEGGCVF
jgi:hypothetical protein